MGEALVLRGLMWQHNLDGPGHKAQSTVIEYGLSYFIYVLLGLHHLTACECKDNNVVQTRIDW